MHLSRLDLADLHAPKLLARTLHDQLGQSAGPVPVVEIAKALDIETVKIDRFDGFEGMLLTNKARSTGGILANCRHGNQRARFTVAHELAHFLLERHVLSDEAGFTCTSDDLRETQRDDRHRRQETEANRFAIELLAPPILFDQRLSDEPDLRDAQRLRDLLDLSLEASVRRMVERHPEPLAAIWSQKGQVRYLVRDPRFPFVTLRRGDRIPQTTMAFRTIANGGFGFTCMRDTHSQAWANTPDLEMREQTRLAANGHAVTLLWTKTHDQDDDDDGGLPELGRPRFR